MIEKTANKPARRNLLWKVRPSVLIAGILGGGTMIVFPAASALVVIYIGLVIAAVGVMAWTGMIALATAAAAALLVPIATVLAIFVVIAAVRCIRRVFRRSDTNSAATQQTNPPQQSLHEWETAVESGD